MTATAEAFRDRFPMLERTNYLASCSLGARSRDLDGALGRMLDAMPDGGWSAFEGEVDRARELFAALVGADRDQIALLPNASTGAYQVASTLSWERRPSLVCSAHEFPSISQVWLAQRTRGARVRPAEDCAAEIDDRTGLVSLPLVDYRDSRRLPVREVADAAHAVGARVFVDAYQVVGVEPVDVAELDCDYLVAGSAKYALGLPGLAFLYVRSPAATDHDPILTGWFGRRNPFAFDPRALDFPDTARRFETGTHPVPACYAANAGMALLADLDLAAVRAHVAALTELAAARLVDQGEKLSTPPGGGAHVAVVEPDSPRLADWLADRRILTSPRGDLLRLSFHYYNNPDDVAEVCDAIWSYRCGP